MKDTGSTITFERLALALAGDYESVYVINNDDDSYQEYAGSAGDSCLKVLSSGSDFYADTIKNCRAMVYREDQDKFLEAFTKKNVYEALSHGKSFTLSYRLVIDGKPVHYFLKTIRGTGADNKFIIIGVQNVNEQVLRTAASNAEKETYHHIANALASRYEAIYYIDAETNAYVQYLASSDYARLGTAKKGTDFFADIITDAEKCIYHEDRERLLFELSKEQLLKSLSLSGSISLIYRQHFGDKVKYLNLHAVNPKNNPNVIVIGVSDIDAQIRRTHSIEKKNEDFSEIIKALTQRYEVIYHVNIETNEYAEYCASPKYAQIKVGESGTDFFGDTQRNMVEDIYPEDLYMMSHAMEKETFLSSLRETGTNTLNYRLMLDGRPQYVTLFAVRPKEDSTHVIIAVANVDAAMRREIEYKKAIGSAMDIATRDALTGVKNKYAYVQSEIALDNEINAGTAPHFALAVADINGLKNINDSLGHDAGDEYIRSACRMICSIFKHSPVYRIGGDEFAVLLQGSDYKERDVLMAVVESAVADNKENGLVTIAVGLSEYQPGIDMKVQDVFKRADRKMYECKNVLRQKGS